MRIIARNKIVEYYTKFNDSETALEEWYIKQKGLNGIVLLT